MTWRDSAEGVRPQVWAVGALLKALADALQARFNPVTVRGEVSGFSRAASGHCYFSLKDESGQLRCAMFRRAAQLSGLELRDGMLVEALGRLDVYGPRGDLQLIVESARPAGQGNLFEQFMRLKAELEAQGLFDPSRKRPLVPLPRSVGVVTSIDAAALRDVITTLQRRAPYLAVRIFPSPVQGDAAPAALCMALDQAYEHHRVSGECDVLLLVRGGGSLEDLWAFNSPALVRKLAQAPMPVVCGVGHETDFTLSDFVADLRAPTPTAAAEVCAPSSEQLSRVLELFASRLRDGVWRTFDERAQRLDRVAQRLGRPSQRVVAERARLASQAHRLQRQIALRLDRERTRIEAHARSWPLAIQRDIQSKERALEQAAQRLQLLDPRLVLQRGYAWLADASGHALTSVSQVQPGQSVQAALADGTLDLTVTAARP
jgi:exodeoxyribonuclease VII large subunit